MFIYFSGEALKGGLVKSLTLASKENIIDANIGSSSNQSFIAASVKERLIVSSSGSATYKDITNNNSSTSDEYSLKPISDISVDNVDNCSTEVQNEAVFPCFGDIKRLGVVEDSSSDSELHKLTPSVLLPVLKELDPMVPEISQLSDHSYPLKTGDVYLEETFENYAKKGQIEIKDIVEMPAKDLPIVNETSGKAAQEEKYNFSLQSTERETDKEKCIIKRVQENKIDEEKCEINGGKLNISCETVTSSTKIQHASGTSQECTIKGQTNKGDFSLGDS